MEIKLNYTVENFQAVDFQYVENSSTDYIAFEYIGWSICNAAVFNTGKFSDIKNYDGRCFELGTPLKIMKEAEEQVTLTSASLVNTDDVIRLESVRIDYSKEDTFVKEGSNLERDDSKYCETNNATFVEGRIKVAEVNRCSPFNPSNSRATTKDYPITLTAPDKLLDDNVKTSFRMVDSIKEGNYKAFELISLKNNSSSRKINIIEQIRAEYIKNLRINNSDQFISDSGTKRVSEIKSYVLKKSVNDMNKNMSLDVKTSRHNNLSITEMLNLSTPDKCVNQPDSTSESLVRETGEVNTLGHLSMQTEDKGVTNDNALAIDTRTKVTSIGEDKFRLSAPTGELSILTSNLLKRGSRDSCYLEDVLADKYNENHEITLHDLKFFGSNLKYMQSVESKFIIKNTLKASKSSGINNSTMGVDVYNKNLMIDKNLISGEVGEKTLQLNNKHSFTDKIEKEPKNSIDKENLIFVWRIGLEMLGDLNLVAVSTKVAKETVSASTITIDRDIYGMFSTDSEKFFSKGGSIASSYGNLFAKKDKYALMYRDTEIGLSKGSKEGRRDYDEVFVSRQGKDSGTIESLLSLDIDCKDTSINDIYISMGHLLREMYINQQSIVVSKRGLDTGVINSYVNLLDTPKSINIAEPDLLLSKRDKAISIAKAMIRVDKNSTDFGSDYYMVALDSTTKDINFDDYCVMIDDKMVDMFINNIDVWTDSSAKDSVIRDKSVSLSNVMNRVVLFTGTTSLDSIVKDITIDDRTTYIDGVVQSMTWFEQGSMIKDYKDIRIYNPDVSLCNNTIPKCAMESAMKTFALKPLMARYSDLQEQQFEIIRLMSDGDAGYLIDKALKDTIYDDKIIKHFLSKNKISAVVPLMEAISKDRVLKDIVMNEGDWLYDNTPHGNLDLTAGGIDELLLPQVDFDYSLFKEGLLDPATHKPISPVKTLPDGSFIAKRPVNHPLPEYTDIAKDYLQVDVSLLRHLLETFYRIWQQNIFKFGAMDMRASVAKMLEYLDAYIDFNIPTPLVAEGKRVVRLIRWYGEASILKHAEYKIKYIYEPLKSGLDTGVCQIPNTMENMFVDTKKFSITNNMLNQDAWVEFEIDNPTDTKMNFMGYISNEGQLEVYINDELDAMYELTQFKVELEIPKATAQKNKVKLFFKSVNNGIINIASVVISDMVYSDVETEYSPTMGSGNKVLDDLVKRVSVYGELYENSQEFISQTINGNLAITDLIDKLNEYFFLHHDRKNKGKRKVTKK